MNIHFDGWSNRWDVVHILLTILLVAKDDFLQSCSIQKAIKMLYRSKQSRTENWHALQLRWTIFGTSFN